MTLQPGTRLGSYEITSLLGSGGMGQVYRAKDLKLGRDVAIKVLREELAQDPGRLRRFEQEARSASALNHPNIITIHDIGKHEATPYIAMEYVEGETLREMLAEGPLPTKKLLQLAMQIAEGLAKAHAAGIVHRDLKPENLMVTSDGYVKILDFGLAKLLPQSGADSEAATITKEGTVAGAVMGTASYMSPEQALGKRLDARTDVFSLGAVLCEISTGTKPFQGETAAALFDQILHKAPPSPSSLNSEVQSDFDRIIHKALEKDPGQRYPSAKELLVDLVAISAGPPITESSSQKSIVVLPFQDISPNKDNEYFSDGLTEEIIADLTQLQQMRVISRSSAMTFKGTKKTVKTIGKELNVQFVLEGSVRKAGDNLRIIVQLIDAYNDSHLWAEKYSGTLDDVFDFQEQVSRSIVDALKLKLSPKEESKIAERQIDNVHAYECYLRARPEIYRFSEEGLERGLQLIRDGLEIAGENALLYAAMGMTYFQFVNAGIRPGEDYLQKAEECADKVVSLRPDSSQGHLLRGLVCLPRGMAQDAVRNFKRALAIDPNDPDAMWWLALMSQFAGKGPATSSLTDRLLEIDPLTPQNHVLPGWLHFMEGRLHLAIEPCKKWHEKDPENPIAHFVYASVLARNRMLEESISLLELLAKKAPETAFGRLGLFFKYSLQGDKADALATVTPELVAAVKHDWQFSWEMATCYAQIGETAQALEWLENAISRGFVNYPFLNQYDPFLENIRGEERFKKLMERVKYEREHFEV